MIHVLPGMGADSSMFRNEWRSIKDCRFLDWPDYRGERSLREIAERVVVEIGINDGDVVIGHSLGGMVACEIAGIRELRHFVLINSAQHHSEVSSLLAALHPLAAFTPFRLAQATVRRLPGDLYQMFVRSNPDFIRATCKAIFEWEGLDEKRIRPKRIHGTWDRIIPIPAEVDLALEGGHLIPVTHARECVNFIRSLP